MTSRIQLNTKGYLDTDDITSIPLDLSISSIKNVGTKPTSKSRSVSLPNTKNNQKLFEQLWNYNVTTGTFNIKQKEEVSVIQNGASIFDGILQLISISNVENVDGSPDIRWNIELNSTIGDLFTNIGDLLLEDIEFSDLDHSYNLTDIQSYFTNDYLDKYKYHLNFLVGSYYSLQDFTPSIFVKTYMDRIFEYAGYSYTLLDQNNRFNKLLIPFNGDNSNKDFQRYSIEDRISVTNDYRFLAGFTSSQPAQVVLQATASGYNRIPLTIKFNDDYTSPNQDPGSIYNVATGIYTANTSDMFSMRAKFNVKAFLRVPTANLTLTPLLISGTKYGISVNTNYIINNVTTGKFFYPSNSVQSIYDDTTSPVTSYAVGDHLLDIKTFEYDTSLYLTIGDQISQYLEAEMNVLGGWVYTTGGAPASNIDKPSLYFEIATVTPTDPTANYYYNLPGGLYVDGSDINMNDFVPKNIKQKDFLKSIATKFNLYFTNDPNNSKNILIETRNHFYDRGDIDDWTYKFDGSTEKTTEFLSNVYPSKKVIFSDKIDNDQWNTSYKERVNQIYGDCIYTFDNEYSQGEQKIETIFSPTPLDNIISPLSPIVPCIPSRNPKTNIRILYDGGMRDGNWALNVSPVIGGTPILNFKTTYPYAGHFDDPLNPTFDINFSQPAFLYYEYLLETFQDSGLFNNYYSRQFKQIENGLMMTAKIHLTELDILNFSFNKKIWIKDKYWVVDSIKGYDANSMEGLTTVDFISIEYEADFTPENFTRKFDSTINRNVNRNYIQQFVIEKSNDYNYNYSSSPYVSISGINNLVQSGSTNIDIIGDNNSVSGSFLTINGKDNSINIDGSIVTGSSNSVYGTSSGSSIVAGDFNTSDGTNFIFGSNTYVSGENSMSIGNNNIVDGDNTLVFGNGSTASGSGIIVFGNNITATNSNTSYFNNIVVTGTFSAASDLFEVGSATGSVQLIPGLSIASGINSFAIGSGNNATGDISYAEGYITNATGFAAHSEGNSTLASGYGSHAEGYLTEASGTHSHAEGYNSIASNLYSHAENTSYASGQESHAEGSFTSAEGHASHSEGDATQASGQGSHSEGKDTVASGPQSHAEGNSTVASGNVSHTEGISTLSTATASHAEGDSSVSSGLASHAEGFGTTASGDRSHAEGDRTISLGYSSHAEGFLTKAFGDFSHAEGLSTVASGLNAAHAEGRETTASSSYAHAEGFGTVASGVSSHAEGENTIASGDSGSHAEGWNTVASGDAGSHAEGYGTTASGTRSHAEGEESTSIGIASHAEGFRTVSSGYYSHSEGNRSVASGQNSHSEGLSTVASGVSSHSGGSYATSSHYSEWSRSSNQIGQYGIVSYLTTTTNDTPTELFLDGSSSRFTLIPNSIYTVSVQAIATIPATGNSKEWHGDGYLFKNISGTTTAVGVTTLVSTNTDATITLATLLMTADNGNDSIKFEGTGLLATTINWFVKLEYTMIGNR